MTNENSFAQMRPEDHPASRGRSRLKRRSMLLIFGVILAQGCQPTEPPSTPAPQSNVPGSALLAASGFDKESVEMIVTVNNRIAVYLVPAKLNRSQLANAPAGLCAYYGKTVRAVEELEPAHPGTLPGALYLVIHCKT